MTREAVILFDVPDIRRIRITCTLCEASVLYPLKSRHIPPTECPTCQAKWADGNHGPEREVIKALRSLLASRRETHVRRRLEVDCIEYGERNSVAGRDE